MDYVGYRLQAKPGLVPTNRPMPNVQQPAPPIQVVSRLAVQIPTISNQKFKPYAYNQVAAPTMPQVYTPAQIPPLVPSPQIIQHSPTKILVQPQSHTIPPQRYSSKDQVIPAQYPPPTPIDDGIKRLQDIGLGRILVMAACGPSMKQVDLSPLKDHPLIDIVCINKPDTRLHPTRYWAFCDQSQYERNKDWFNNYTGLLINPISVRARHKNQVLIKVLNGSGFSKNLYVGYFIGRSSTYAMMQVAHFMNYNKVFIFGCDMAADESGAMWSYGNNPDVSPDIRTKRFAKEAEHYLLGAQQLSETERKRYIFCSSYLKWEFVKYFHQLDHKIAVPHVLSEADNLRPK